ncbi:hypothetical protein SNR37_003849 [Agarivorans aestuarii]|uniref:Lipoprotein n=1 Tax=Agarivorans aestuarii TaxID=1563703 RepID=A0ABU7G7I3_9ALTE|nr:hypothetical protein [Agarivorans aestuarii]MEE1674410.1 hypothetical protein [Agarivorans aestuarii]
MRKLLVAMALCGLPALAFASVCSKEGFADASNTNQQIHQDIEILSKQYVAICSWDYDMPRDKVCKLFTDKRSQLALINQVPLNTVLDNAEKATEHWYSVHEACASEGNKSNADLAFKGYEESFDVYSSLINEIDTRYKQSCHQQIEAKVEEFCD